MQVQKITPQELSENTKIDRSTLTRILNNSTSKPRLETIHTLARYFNVDPEYLLCNNYNAELKFNQSTNKKDIRETLNELMIQTGILNLSLLHKYTDVPISVLSDILNGKTVKPNLKTMLKLSNFFNITISQLTGNETLPLSQLSKVTPMKRSVPLLNIDNFTKWLEDKNIENLEYVTVNRPGINDNAFSIKINSNLFEPDFLNQQILIVDTQTPESGDFLIATINNTLSIFEYMLDNNQIYLRNVINHSWFEVKEVEMKLHGVIIQKIINIK